MTERSIAVVTAGLSQPSSTRLLADRLATATRDALLQGGDEASIHVVELRELATDIAHHLVTQVPGAALRSALDTVRSADGLIAVTPVFTASYSGLFKSFVDVIGNEDLVGLPVLLGATGGTERHSLVLDYQMRGVFAYLRALPAPTAVYAASSDWGSGDGHLGRRIERAAGEFAELVAGRTPPRPSTSDSGLTSVPFEQLLTGE
ncbi:FMN reductase [Phytoactinopolyspora alkaliphila]|uniref:FMN reductase n=1 Tax=Phytoactinopolyspora alkaliphila TaxID=1783498 RepID=A0A6N9YN48_9ACTN|nr:FMN reductase [Phytoactinopolyspora alkaliphila]NED96404.1 FMN reductase [Phytoactinopolyspora alkaliphila]